MDLGGGGLAHRYQGKRLVAAATVLLILAAAAGAAVWVRGEGGPNAGPPGAGRARVTALRSFGTLGEQGHSAALAAASPGAAAAVPVPDAAQAAPAPSPSGSADSTASPAQATPEPLICDGCAPPLKSFGGPVMGTPARPGEVTITPIYWQPKGYGFTTSYTGIIDQYIDNVAAASGSDNTYAVDTEYSGIRYLIHAGTPVTDRTAFPGGCAPDANYRTCIGYKQLTRELARFVAARHLPTGLAHLYPVFLPAPAQVGVEPDGLKSGSTFCAFHDWLRTSSGADLVFAVEPYGDVCPNGQAPNGDAAADTGVDTLSHEIIEAITDPISPAAWRDPQGNENGDECNGNYGPPLGSTDPAHPNTTRYTQLINGGRYYTQTNFSNARYAGGAGAGCIQGNAQPRVRAKGPAAPRTMNAIDVVAAQDHLAPGAATTITATVTDPTGAPVVGDDVSFRAETRNDSPGTCGSLDPPPGTPAGTDAAGRVSVRYRASIADATCDIQAIEGATGQTDSTQVDQGTARQDSPTIEGGLPASLVPGEAPETATVTVTNPSSHALADARVAFVFTGDNDAARGVRAGEIQLSATDSAHPGSAMQIPLTGSTVGGDEIFGSIPVGNGSLAAGQTDTITLQVSIDSSTVLTAETGNPLHVEANLDQVRPSDGSATTVDSAASDVVIETALSLVVDPVVGLPNKLGVRVGG